MSEQTVTLCNVRLADLFGKQRESQSNSLPLYKLVIPDYQRKYCWEEKQVYQLWQDILHLEKSKVYHLGSIILHEKNGEWDVVDGQQRLITLSLIIDALSKNLADEGICNPLMDSEVYSKEAIEYIAYNKHLIGQYVSFVGEEKKKNLLDLIYDHLQFSVLSITAETLDLAYTFFSNQNSKGKPLSDYNLLKAHHLRYVLIEEQAKHLAARWDNLIVQDDDSNSDVDLERTLGMYLFRLRKWMKKKYWNESKEYRVKDEFEAALTIPEIPPFGEKFYYYEKIQGGTHFFAYAEFFVQHFKNFRETIQIKALHEHLQYESHWRYRDCIETLLFGYYLKFGEMYFTEALVCIERIISQQRYLTKRAYLYKVFEYANETEIILMIDQATSPTFFLAEALDKIKKSSLVTVLSPIQNRYRNQTKQIYQQINAEVNTIDPIKAIISYEQ